MTKQTESSVGRVAFIPGAANGIGRAAALGFAREGANLVLADVLEDELSQTRRLVEDLGVRVLAVRCDVSQSEDIKAALASTEEAFGLLDYAFNNAGVEEPLTPMSDVAEEEWNRVIGINLSCVYMSMKYQIPLMLKHSGGSIVNTSSRAGVKGSAGQGAYCASKFGIIGLSKAATLDYGDANIRINVVCPGIIDTPMMDRFSGDTPEGRAGVIAQKPIGRMGKPEEIAAASLWLCSDAAAFVLGHALVIDGGQTL